MRKLVRPYLNDILGEIADIDGIMQGKSLGDYDSDRRLQKVVKRSIEIMSEAARRIPQELCDSRPEVRWHQIRAIGNVLRHEYRDVINGILYAVIRDDLRALKAAILAIDATLDEPRE
ncbi:MAG: HepT-like ribonuclease domain-containing protein [Bauldia sp.]